jgi:hypothetical protein
MVGKEREVNWRSRLAAHVVVLALAACDRGTTGQSGAPYAPCSPEKHRNMPEHGGGDGGGGGSGM